MKRWRTAGIVLLSCTAVIVMASRSSGGQLGGLIRRGIPDSVKKAGGDKPDEAKKPEPSEPAKTPAAPAAANTDVIPITEEVLTGLERGLQTELDLRAKLKTELEANEKARTDYDACKKQVPLSAEAQQIALRMANLPSNAKPEDMQKFIASMNQDMEALILKRCGSEPQRIDVGKRLLAIQAQGAAATGIGPRGAR